MKIALDCKFAVTIHWDNNSYTLKTYKKPGPLRDGVEGQIPVVGGQKLLELVVRHAAGFQGVGDNFRVCHGKNLL